MQFTELCLSPLEQHQVKKKESHFLKKTKNLSSNWKLCVVQVPWTELSLIIMVIAFDSACKLFPVYSIHTDNSRLHWLRNRFFDSLNSRKICSRQKSSSYFLTPPHTFWILIMKPRNCTLSLTKAQTPLLKWLNRLFCHETTSCLPYPILLTHIKSGLLF